MCGEVKQTEMLGFGAEKGLFQGQVRRMGSSCSKDQNSLMGLEEEFHRQHLGAGMQGVCPSSDWLVGR